MLLAKYNDWARTNGEDPVSSNAFAELVDRILGLTRTRGRGGVRLTLSPRHRERRKASISQGICVASDGA
jgi:hypothetical protein